MSVKEERTVHYSLPARLLGRTQTPPRMLDLVILAALVLGLWRGFRQGAIMEVARIVGVVLSFVLAVHLKDTVGLIVVASLDLAEEVAPVVGFIVVFSAVTLLIHLTARFAQWLIGSVKLGGLNRLAGGLVGGAKAALLLSIAFLLLGNMGVPSDDARSGSSLYPAVYELAPAAWDALSTAIPGARDLALPVGDRLDRELQERLVEDGTVEAGGDGGALSAETDGPQTDSP